MSNAIISISVLKSLILSYQQFAMDVLMSKNLNPNIISSPLEIQQVVYGSSELDQFEASLTQFMAPGMIIALIFFAPLALTVFLMIKERKDGLLERTLVSGVGCFEILMSHFCIQSLVLFIQTGLMIFTTFFIWQIPMRGTLFDTFSIVYIQGMVGIFVGLLISSICHNEFSAMIVGSGKCLLK